MRQQAKRHGRAQVIGILADILRLYAYDSRESLPSAGQAGMGWALKADWTGCLV